MIVSYGLKFVLPCLVLAIGFTLWGASRNSQALFLMALLFALVTLFLSYFYRNPVRTVPVEKNLILSVADGIILSVEGIDNEYIGGKGTKVSIFLSIFDVHINRIPIDGRIDYVKYHPGEFNKAFVDKASSDNESCEVGLIFDSGKMIFKQIAGILARRIEYSIVEKQEMKAGEIYGMIHFGSRAELFLPGNIEVVVKKGDKISAGVSVIGKIMTD